jgi:hypothetical protein
MLLVPFPGAQVQVFGKAGDLQKMNTFTKMLVKNQFSTE